jgi:hypothetical protein
MAPQAIGIAQNGLGNGARRFAVAGKEEAIRRISYQFSTGIRLFAT